MAGFWPTIQQLLVQWVDGGCYSPAEKGLMRGRCVPCPSPSYPFSSKSEMIGLGMELWLCERRSAFTTWYGVGYRYGQSPQMVEEMRLRLARRCWVLMADLERIWIWSWRGSQRIGGGRAHDSFVSKGKYVSSLEVRR
jgi:hypothetical protein